MAADSAQAEDVSEAALAAAHELFGRVVLLIINY